MYKHFTCTIDKSPSARRFLDGPGPSPDVGALYPAATPTAALHDTNDSAQGSRISSPSAAGFCTPLSTTSQSVLLDWPPSPATLPSAHLFLVRVHHYSTPHPGTSLTRFPRRLSFTAPQQLYRRGLAPHTPGWVVLLPAPIASATHVNFLGSSAQPRRTALYEHATTCPEPLR